METVNLRMKIISLYVPSLFSPSREEDKEAKKVEEYQFVPKKNREDKADRSTPNSHQGITPSPPFFKSETSRDRSDLPK